LIRGATKETSKLTIPEGNKKEHFVRWVEQLPNVESPLWLGMPDNAENLLLKKKGQAVIQKLYKLQTLEDDDSTEESNSSKTEDRKPTWMRILRASIDDWRKVLPEKLPLMERTAESVKNPLFRFFEREVEIGAKLLKKVRSELNDLAQICDGTLKQTNYTRGLIGSLSKGVIPKEWKRYPIPSYVSVNIWVKDLALRIQQLQDIKKTKDYGRNKLWLGGLFNPEAYITASRQGAAQANGWSVENLELVCDVLDPVSDVTANETCFIIRDGLSLEGATWSNKKLELAHDISCSLPPTKFTWRYKTEKLTEQSPNDNKINIPVYLSDTRAELLFSVDLDAPKDVPRIAWFQRGVALTVWKPTL